ncbi:MAG: hypothetical protein IPM50_09220 [Acidobacteriota bacterium]|nr:MAG: hypothetical protein IPM50_09220 [Acidobacteriota bacterium]
MIEIKNVSNNPLVLSDGKLLAAGESRKFRSASDRERSFAARGWLEIIALKPDEKTVETKPENGGKK